MCSDGERPLGSVEQSRLSDLRLHHHGGGVVRLATAMVLASAIRGPTFLTEKESDPLPPEWS